MPGLVPGMRVFASASATVDGRNRPGHDSAYDPKRSARNGLGSQNGVAPVIISAINRPVTGPSVSPQ
jgi:hypothetical protein